VLPSPGLLTLFPLLCFAAFISSMSGMTAGQLTLSGPLVLLWCLGALIGAAVVVTVLASLETSCVPAERRIAAMIRDHQVATDPSGPLNFEAAFETVRGVGSLGVPVWITILASSAVLIFTLRFFLPIPLVQSLGLGLALGAATAGTLVAWSLQDSHSQIKRTFARLALVSSLVQVTWLFATTLVQF
jgi:hypothetical protein